MGIELVNIVCFGISGLVVPVLVAVKADDIADADVEAGDVVVAPREVSLEAKLSLGRSVEIT